MKVCACNIRSDGPRGYTNICEGDSTLSFRKPGVEIDIFDGGESDPRSRHMMPLWKRQFEAVVGGIEFTSLIV